MPGDVSFEAGGQTYRLRYSINALCDMEEALGMGVRDFYRLVSSGDLRMTHVRGAFWAGLRQHQPSITKAQAGDIIQALGGVDAATELLGEALTRAFPPVVPGEGGGSNPPLG